MIPAPKSSSSGRVPGDKKPRREFQKRKEQQRAIETREVILQAALSEFAEKGFDAATTRGIAQRANIQHPRITYHYRNKEVLWRAVAEHFFAEIQDKWDRNIPDTCQMSAKERVHEEFRAFFRFTMEHPDFHNFMLRENRPNNPRLPWLVEAVVSPIVSRLLNQIRAAQQAGDLPEGSPILIVFMLIGATSALSTLRPQLNIMTNFLAETPAVAKDYEDIFSRLIFGSEPLK